MCLVLIFSFVFIKPKEDVEQAEALAPIAAWAVSIIGGLIIEIAVDMGVKFVDKKAREGFKTKILNKIWGKNGDIINDLKPTKKNGLKWLFKAPKWLLTLITGAITTEIIQTKLEDDERTENVVSGKPIVPSPNDSDVSLNPVDPFYNTNIHITKIIAGENPPSIELKKRVSYLNSWVNYKVSPVSYATRSKLEVSPYKDFSSSTVIYIAGGFKGELKLGVGTYYRFTSDFGSVFYSNATTSSKTTTLNLLSAGPIWGAYEAFEVYLKQLEEKNKKIYYANGLLVSEYQGLIQLPQDLTVSDLEKLDYSKLPPAIQNDKNYEFEIKDTTLINVDQWELLKEGDKFEWTLVENEIVNQGDTIYNTIINNDYNPTINNNYFVTPEVQENINSQLPSTDGSKPPATGGDVDKIDGSLIAYIKNAYEYATGVIKSGVDGLKALGTGAVELTKLYGVFFSWLPKDIVVLMTSGLAIMLGLRIFRK